MQNAWRREMSSKEVAKYDAGKYDVINAETGAKDLRKAPRESMRISHDNTLVPLAENDSINMANPTTPEHSTLAAELGRALRILGSIPQACGICGQCPAKGAGCTILKYDGDDIPQVLIRCRMCSDALNINWKPDDSFSKLPVLERRMWKLLNDGLTESQIAARLTNGSQRVTQQMVSKTKQKIIRLINESRRTGYGSRL